MQRSPAADSLELPDWSGLYDTTNRNLSILQREKCEVEFVLE